MRETRNAEDVSKKKKKKERKIVLKRSMKDLSPLNGHKRMHPDWTF